MRITAFALAGAAGLWFICAPLLVSIQAAQAQAGAKSSQLQIAQAQTDATTSLGAVGSWQARTTAQNGTTLCYVSSAPSQIGRTVKGRDQTGILVTHAADGTARDQVSVALGFPPRKGTSVGLRIGKRSFTLQKIDGDRAWSSSDSLDRQIVAAMKRVDEMTVQATAANGRRSLDRYNLSGFGAAYGKITKACGL